MNYSALLKALSIEAKTKSKLKKKNIVVRIILTIIFIPIFISFFFTKLGFWFLMFFFKMISAPADYLCKWLDSQKDGVQHATQAVLYLVCMPTIFGIQVALSFNAFAFYLQWFSLQIHAFILTLGGTKWQPFITEAKFED
jgi:hypothetical protein